MIYEYKLIPIDRQDGHRVWDNEELQPQFTVNIDELHRTMEKVNPIERSGLPALVLSEQQDKLALAGTVARTLSEMWGADVMYREQTAAPDKWHLQWSVWRPRSERAERRQKPR